MFANSIYFFGAFFCCAVAYWLGRFKGREEAEDECSKEIQNLKTQLQMRAMERPLE